MPIQTPSILAFSTGITLAIRREEKNNPYNSPTRKQQSETLKQQLCQGLIPGSDNKPPPRSHTGRDDNVAVLQRWG